MNITVLTMCPEMFGDFLASPIIRRACDRDLVRIRIVDFRDYAGGSFRHIDDSPYGGGAGMIIRCQPVADALDAVRGSGQGAADGTDRGAGAAGGDSGQTAAAAGGTGPASKTSCGDTTVDSRCVMLVPVGKPYVQADAERFSKLDHLILVCGHYEGFDARLYEEADELISIGDYILTGGELAAMVVMDSVIRLIPGVLRTSSTQEESFADGLLEYPQYTRPADFRGRKVPEVLLSGDHEAIREWRKAAAIEETRRRRPELLE